MQKLRVIYQLSESIKKILIALLGALIVEPTDLVVRNKEDVFLKKIETLVREFPRFTRFGFLFLLILFDRLPFFFNLGFTRFVNLDFTKQQKYVTRWHDTPSTVLREIFKTIRGIVMVAYFSHHDVWNYIDYDPKKHAAERIALRHKIMHPEKESTPS